MPEPTFPRTRKFFDRRGRKKGNFDDEDPVDLSTLDEQMCVSFYYALTLNSPHARKYWSKIERQVKKSLE